MTSYDPFAEFAAFDVKPAAPPAPAAPVEPQERKPIMQQHQTAMQQHPQQQAQQQPQQPQQQPPVNYNPFGGGYNAPSPGVSPQMAQQQPPASAYQQPGMTQTQLPMVPAVQQPNQWSVPQQQQQPPAYQQPVSPQQQQQQQQPPAYQQPSPPQQMIPNSNQSLANGSYMTTPTDNLGANLSPSPQQQPYAQQQQMATSPYQQAPPTHSAPAAVVQEDDDFFGAFSNTVQEVVSPNRPPSVFEANQNDDVSYLSKSTGGGTERGHSILDDPKFAPKPPAVHGLANAQALSQHAPPGASPLPDFELVMHSGYVLARISFRTILIKKWKQSFWIIYGDSQLMFFRSSADFEDWISNPYLSQAQRDFLVKLKIDFVGDMKKQGVRGYQVTPPRLKNYNNKMLHQFKLERWMDYGPTIAAAFASPNERELRNLRTVCTELLKKAPQNTATAPRQPVGNPYQYNAAAPNQQGYGGPANTQSQYAQDRGEQQYPYSSSASTGRLEYGQAGSVHSHSQHSHKSYGVMSAGPVEMSRDQYVAGYRVSTAAGPSGRY